MATIAELNNLQAQAVKVAAEAGLAVTLLTNDELLKFDRSFARQFVLPCLQREIGDIFIRHKGEILLGAMVAKAQFDDVYFDGEQPDAGKFGMVQIQAGYVGYDDWDELGSITGGAPQNWIHSGTTILGGTAGNALKITENAVHVIIGIGTYAASPRITCLQQTVDGETEPLVNVELQFRASNLKMKEFDNARILKKNTTYLVKIFCYQTGNDVPYLLGVSFIKEDKMRLNDPSTMDGATELVTTS